MLLANHGPVVAGDSLEGAVFATEELEETAKLFLLLRDSIRVISLRSRSPILYRPSGSRCPTLSTTTKRFGHAIMTGCAMTATHTVLEKAGRSRLASLITRKPAEDVGRGTTGGGSATGIQKPLNL